MRQSYNLPISYTDNTIHGDSSMLKTVDEQMSITVNEVIQEDSHNKTAKNRFANKSLASNRQII